VLLLILQQTILRHAIFQLTFPCAVHRRIILRHAIFKLNFNIKRSPGPLSLLLHFVPERKLIKLAAVKIKPRIQRHTPYQFVSWKNHEQYHCLTESLFTCFNILVKDLWEGNGILYTLRTLPLKEEPGIY
jgi:hypothetical protein